MFSLWGVYSKRKECAIIIIIIIIINYYYYHYYSELKKYHNQRNSRDDQRMNHGIYAAIKKDWHMLVCMFAVIYLHTALDPFPSRKTQMKCPHYEKGLLMSYAKAQAHPHISLNLFCVLEYMYKYFIYTNNEGPGQPCACAGLAWASAVRICHEYIFSRHVQDDACGKLTFNKWIGFVKVTYGPFRKNNFISRDMPIKVLALHNSNLSWQEY